MFASKEDLAAKVEWEGGLVDAIQDYGLKVEDLPPGTPEWVKEDWKRVQDNEPVVRRLEGWLEEC